MDTDWDRLSAHARKHVCGPCLHGGQVTAAYGGMLVLYPAPTLILTSFVGVAPNDAFIAKALETLSMILVIGGAIVQFPLYGFILSYAKLRESCWLVAGAGIIWLHLFAIAVWLVITGVQMVLLKL